MALNDEERKIRLRPPKPRVARNEGAAWSNGFKLLMHYARSSRKTRNRGSRGKGKHARPYHQRCAVRVTYLKNKVRGQWKAHGRYLARESATFEKEAHAAGFNRESGEVDVTQQLENWQAAGDELMWKLIVSPEFGDRMDLSRLTRDLIERMGAELGTDLEWVAVEHNNTEHPHVHAVVRGVRNGGEVLRLKRDYVQHGIRSIAEDLCTRQLGYRTEIDAAEAERREISEKRFTSLDRSLLREARQMNPNVAPQYFMVSRNLEQAGLSETLRLHTQHEIGRLAVLRQMGLAESMGPCRWRVRRDFEEILRAMQRTTDRQRTLAVHGVLLSDERLPIKVVDPRQLVAVEGRVLVHGQDEQSGRNYLMLEGTDATVHFIYYTPEMEEARSKGGLRTNSFVRLRKLFGDGSSVLHIEDLGDAQLLLDNRAHLGETVRRLLKRGIVPTTDGWGGWLGRYQVALRETALEMAERNKRDHMSASGRRRDRSPGR